MAVEAGFDMVPCLSQEEDDKQKWNRFISTLKYCFHGDKNVEVKPTYLVFKIGDHPQIPFEGHKFLRFSLKLPDTENGVASIEQYISTVGVVAQHLFGSRIKLWRGKEDGETGHYSQTAVLDSIKSYGQVEEAECSTSAKKWFRECEPTDVSNKPLPFEVQEVAGKGRGCIARENIARGACIMVEVPLFDLTPGRNSSDKDLEVMIGSKLKLLSKEQQRQFLALHNNSPGRYPFHGTFTTNALPCGYEAHSHAVYATLSFFNHSCLPNAQYVWNPEKKHESVYAHRDIAIGEDITVSYREMETHMKRQATLKKHFGFECGCVLCSLPPIQRAESDARIAQIEAIDKEIPRLTEGNPATALAKCRSMLHLLNRQRAGTAWSLAASLYNDAFQIAVYHGDRARASTFAKRSYEARIICQGANSPETQRMKSLMVDPSRHKVMGMQALGLCSKRWSKSKAPAEHVSDDEMEEWLWNPDSASK